MKRAERSHKDLKKKKNSSQRELGPPVVEIEFNVDFGRFCGGIRAAGMLLVFFLASSESQSRMECSAFTLS